MGKLENKISRLLSRGLRHDPSSLGLTLDSAGWASTADILHTLKKKFPELSPDLLKNIVQAGSPKRFTTSPDGTRIRAISGHSIDITLPATQKPPPEFLYHSTTAALLDQITYTGLLKGTRQYVHLYGDSRQAHHEGTQQGKNIILEIAAGLMASHRFSFLLAENGIWLTHEVPPDYLNRHFTIA